MLSLSFSLLTLNQAFHVDDRTLHRRHGTQLYSCRNHSKFHSQKEKRERASTIVRLWAQLELIMLHDWLCTASPEYTICTVDRCQITLSRNFDIVYTLRTYRLQRTRLQIVVQLESC